jgi:Xaa-Pro aminopeptidase
MTRTIVKGEPGEQLRRMYDAVRRAQEVAIQQIRPGANGKDVHTAVEAVFAAEGFAGEGPGPRYTHGTGHGVGLNVHEPPALSTVDMPLEENDVVTVEPGLYDPDVGAVRLEDLIVVTRDGCRNLTRFPKQFVV